MKAVSTPSTHSTMKVRPASPASKVTARTSSLLQKPERGGMPAMDMQEMSMVIMLTFMYLPRPPIWARSSVCT